MHVFLIKQNHMNLNALADRLQQIDRIIWTDYQPKTVKVNIVISRAAKNI